MPIFSGRCYSNVRLDGKTAIVTGCNSGIGKETVIDFYRRGARVLMACRNIQRVNEAFEDIQKQCQNEAQLGSIKIIILDLNSLASVRECAKNILSTESEINILVNNAGIMTCPEGKTEDGFETQFGTNHLAHFLFTLLLLPRIIRSTPARIVTVSSMVHEYGTIDFDDLMFEKKPYKPLSAYSQSKIANILFSMSLDSKLKAHNIEGVTTYSLHPGVIATELGRHFDTAFVPGMTYLFHALRWLIKSPELGAQTSIYCAVDEKCANESGLYYSDCIPINPTKEARDPQVADKLWEVSCKLVGIENWDPFTAEDKNT